MGQNSPPADWFFPIEEAPVLVTVTRNGVSRDVRVPHKKALGAADTREIGWNSSRFRKVDTLAGHAPKKRRRKHPVAWLSASSISLLL